MSKKVTGISSTTVAYCSSCQQAFTRRELGICEGKLCCEDCWPDDVGGTDEAEIGECSISKQGFRVLVSHGVM